MSIILLLTLAAPNVAVRIDLPFLDDAIERCERGKVLPIFATEPTRRNAALTTAYVEQAAISAQRVDVAARRRLLRESALGKPAGTAPPAAGASDAELALAQLALDDRQRALDDARRLEGMRHDAVSSKRLYFLSRCGASKAKAD